MKFIKLIKFVLLFCASLAFAQNSIKVPDSKAGPGEKTKILIDLTNTDQIVGFQFILTVPKGMVIDEQEIQLTERKGNHALSVKKLNDTQYSFLGFSLSANDFFKGNSGTLIEIPVKVPESFKAGQTYDMGLSGVLLSNAQAENVGSGHQDGKLIITDALAPDLEVSGVVTSQTEILPKGTVSVSWGVRNIGDKAVEGGWTEQVSLVSDKSGQKYIVGKISYGEGLGINQSVSRNGTFSIPEILGMDGKVKIEVELIPDAAVKEPETARENNKAVSAVSVEVKKQLFLTIDKNKKEIQENSGEKVKVTLTRSGDRSQPQTFTLKVSPDGQLIIPVTVTINEGESSVIFYIEPIDNSQADGDRMITITAFGNGYPEISDDVKILDDEVPLLTLTSSKETVNQGDKITLTVTTDLVSSQDVKITLVNELPKRWKFPEETILPAGQKSVTFEVEILETQTPEAREVGKITARAVGYRPGTIDIILASANIPKFELTISPSTISEGDGVNATYAVLKRLDNKEVKVDVVLKADIADALIFPGKITFESGVSQQKFVIGVVDNSIVDGTRTVTVTASVFIPSCGCTGEAGGASGMETSQQVTILDNDGLALEVKANPSTVKAGQEKAAKITISRNTTKPEELVKPVTVKLSSDAPTIIEIPATVTIPAGQQSVEVEINTKIDTNKKGDQTIRIEAVAEQYSAGFGWILVTDQNKPDAIVSQVSSLEVLEGGSEVSVTVQIKNQGFSVLPKGMKVEYYFSSNTTVKGITPFAEAVTDQEIPAGNSIDFIQTVQVPETAGKYNLVIVLNSDKKIEELTYTNNQGEKFVELIPGYTAEVTTDKKVYKPGEVISMTGSAKTTKGAVAANKEVEIKINTNGFVRTFKVQTNASGNFAYDFIPLSGENGHYGASAGYPGTEVKTQAEFDVLGVIWLNKPSDYLKWEVVEGKNLEGEFKLKNNTHTNLTNIQVKLPADADFTLQAQSLNLNAGQEGVLKYTLIPNGASPVRKYYEIKAEFISVEGAKTPFTSWYYCHAENAKLTADPVSINTTMVKGATRLYEFNIINTGSTEAKNLKIDIPKVDWMKLKTPFEIEKLGSYDTLRVVLELRPTGQQQLNTSLSGNIAVNIANGQGIDIPFKVETVSEAKGALQIDVVDEYTYNTEKAPHVQGARIVVRHPYSGMVVAEGTTNEQGLFTTDNIPEGWYTVTVTANKHDSYQNNIQVEPGRIKKETVFLSYQAVSYEWTVKPTEVEDEYQIDLDVKFETNVPKPVVVFEYDKTLIDLEPGESKILNVQIVNYGLISALDISLSTNEVDGYTFTFLVNSISELSAKSSITVPLLIQKNKMGAKSLVGCMNAFINGMYYLMCGPERYSEKMNSKLPLPDPSGCSGINFPGFNSSVSSGGPGSPGGGGSNSAGSTNGEGGTGYSSKLGCNQCTVQLLLSFLGCHPAGAGISCGISLGMEDYSDWKATVLTYLGCHPAYGCVAGFVGALYCFSKMDDNPENKVMNSSSFVKLMTEDFELMTEAEDAFYKKLELVLDNNDLVYGGEFKDIIVEVALFLDNKRHFSESDIATVKSNLSYLGMDNYLDEFCKRWNLSLEAWDKNITIPNTEYPNIIDKGLFDSYTAKAKEAKEYVKKRGFTSLEEMYEQDIQELKIFAENGNSKLKETKTKSNSVCATVTVRFSQKMTMTREAFEGTLTLNNGSETKELKEVNLDLVITDEDGNDMTHLFQINRDAFLSGTGIVNAQGSESGMVLFIPTKEAAPTVAKSYLFGGILSYLDPESGEKVTVKLYPVTLEVNPSPDLVLHYFMQRDIIGDDPLTEKIEPMVPAEMSLLIKNEGYGIAKNVKIQSMQPEIIENKKGLLIDFEMIGSSLNGASKQLGLLEVDFGNIAPQKAMVGQWWFTSTLLGHFVEYDIKVKHLSSYGNKDLSLIKDYQVHELIKSVKAYGTVHDDIPDFLVNDIADINDTPDRIYYSNGDSEEVSKAQAASASNFISPSQLTTQLSVTPYISGWNYGNIDDPGRDLYKLVKVVRNEDKLELPIENFWQTFVTLRDGADPKYENKLHFVDKISAAATYTLYYTPVDMNVPKVISFENVPESGTTTQPVEYVQVNFNKPIDKTTFTYKNLNLLYQGNKVTLTPDKVNIAFVNDSVFVVDIKAFTPASGYYELTVQCAGIKDLKGNEGTEGKAVSWTQVIGELGIIQFTSDQNKSQPLNSVEILFNRKVSSSEFTADKVTVNGNQVGNISIENPSGDQLNYILTGLQGYNNADGAYELSVNLPAMKAQDGSTGLIVQSYKWKVDKNLPEIDTFTPQYQGAVHTQNVTDMQVAVNKPVVTDLKPEWISLYKGSVKQNVTLTISKQDDLHYLISGLGEYTQAEGGYKLEIDQTQLEDEFGNYGLGTASTHWTVSFVKPLPPVEMRVTPDKGVSGTDNITSGKDIKVSLKTVEDKRTVALYVITPTGESLVKEVYQETAGVVEISVSEYTGKNTFKAVVYDAYKTMSDPVSIEAYLDVVALQASVTSGNQKQSDCSELEYADIIFTEPIETGFGIHLITVKASGVSVTNHDLVLTPVSDQEFRLENLQNLAGNGDISIEIDMTGVTKKLSGLPGEGKANYNLGSIFTSYTANINGEKTVLAGQEVTYQATSGMSSYQWKVSGGTIQSQEGETVTIRWEEEGIQTLSLNYTTPGSCSKTTSKAVEVQKGLSVDDLSKDPEEKVLRISPVPNDGTFTLFLSGETGIFDLKIYDMSGRIVHKQDKIQITSDFKEKIYTQLNSGVYQLLLHNSKSTYKVRFIVE